MDQLIQTKGVEGAFGAAKPPKSAEAGAQRENLLEKRIRCARRCQRRFRLPKEIGQEAGNTPGCRRGGAAKMQVRARLGPAAAREKQAKGTASQGRRGSALPSKQE